MSKIRHLVRKSGVMVFTDFWVPGTIVQIEYPENVSYVSRKGYGTFIKQNGGFNWFHFPIAVSYCIVDQFLACQKVFVFFRTDGPYIANIHVHSGGELVVEYDNLHVAGDMTEIRDGLINYWDVGGRGIPAGLGVSVGVNFDNAGEIMFTAAGAYFDTTAGS
jgi:uncharacterized protein DUF6623